jgi:hypothetical protein
MAVEFNLCEVIQIMLVLDPKMLWDAIRKGTLKRNIRRSRETVFAPVIEYRERRTPLAFTPMFRRALTPPPSPSPSVEQGVPTARRQWICACRRRAGSSSSQSRFERCCTMESSASHLCICTRTRDSPGYTVGSVLADRSSETTGQDTTELQRYILRCLHMVDPGFYQQEPSHPGIGLLRVCRRM